jgi:two-component system nitrogen regulation response regulator NtrX
MLGTAPGRSRNRAGQNPARIGAGAYTSGLDFHRSPRMCGAPEAANDMNTDRQKVLIVDDQRAVREQLAFALGFEGYAVLEAQDGREALEQVAQGGIDLVLLDIKMPKMDGLEVLARLRETGQTPPVIMISGHGDIETAVLAIKGGAQDYLAKPFDNDRVIVSVKNALRIGALQSENRALRTALADTYKILGESPAITAMRRTLERAAPTDAQVLITGENGTGKELVARQVHALSPRSQGPFVAVNCAAIPADLIESELFGHERGAFTGADRARAGHFESAAGGTLFLDEIGDMALDAQAKLLRALQERVVTRVGGGKSIPVDVRVVAATNQDLQDAVQNGTFREDLYYRLHVVPIHVPALRDRREDIPLLSAHFLEDAARRNGIGKRTWAAAACRWLGEQPWPGNVRQLRNLCEAAAILSEGHEVQVEDLTALAADAAARPGAAAGYFGLPTLEEFRAASEREFIRRKLEENGGNIKRTAEQIGIQRSNLYKKLERYSLK